MKVEGEADKLEVLTDQDRMMIRITLPWAGVRPSVRPSLRTRWDGTRSRERDEETRRRKRLDGLTEGGCRLAGWHTKNERNYEL